MITSSPGPTPTAASTRCSATVPLAQAMAFGCSRESLRLQLARRGIETRSFFVPIHAQPVYRDQSRGQRFPVAERLCAAGCYLPTHEGMTEPDADWICRQIAEIHRLAAGASRRR
jgi:dTDP-4-amino-4,6-dideoxygalactose transaminase